MFTIALDTYSSDLLTAEHYSQQAEFGHDCDLSHVEEQSWGRIRFVFGCRCCMQVCSQVERMPNQVNAVNDMLRYLSPLR